MFDDVIAGSPTRDGECHANQRYLRRHLFSISGGRNVFLAILWRNRIITNCIVTCLAAVTATNLVQLLTLCVFVLGSEVSRVAPRQKASLVKGKFNV